MVADDHEGVGGVGWEKSDLGVSVSEIVNFACPRNSDVLVVEEVEDKRSMDWRVALKAEGQNELLVVTQSLEGLDTVGLVGSNFVEGRVEEHQPASGVD